MTAKILKADGHVINTLTYWALTLDEMNLPEEIKVPKEFDAAIKARYGDGASYDDFNSDPDWDMPTYEKYEDEMGGAT